MDEEVIELNERVISILGDDHPVSQMIENGEEGLMIHNVLLAVLVSLTDRIDMLEAKITGRGLN